MRLEKQETGQSNVTIDETITFREVLLSTPQGRDVLKWLLLNLGLYKPIVTDEGIVLHNFAIKLLSVLDLHKQPQLESMIDYYSELAKEDALHPGKRSNILEKLNVERNDS